MLNVTVICVGKLKEAYLREGCAEYAKRLRAYCRLEVVEVEEERLPDRPSPAQVAACIEGEGRRIEARIPLGAYRVPLCVEGKPLDSVELSRAVERAAVSGRSCVAFLVGGSYGLWEPLKERAELRLSMSRMTFPHQLARLMLLEQVYRAFQISGNGKYHK